MTTMTDGKIEAQTGKPYPLGAAWDGRGVNFALFSEHAMEVTLCLFDSADDAVETARVPLSGRTNHVWHAYLPGEKPGRCYGYRVRGPYAPEQGHRFNQHKLLIDPYAKALTGELLWDDSVYGYQHGDARADLSFDDRASGKHVPKSLVIDPSFAWAGDHRPRTAWADTVIYECHVKGMTAAHPEVPEELRGTYLGLASEPVIDHLTSLRITAVELLPVHHAVDEHALVKRGLRNFWGYNTLGFFAPYSRYATGSLGAQVDEFKLMVKRLHAAGFEVILDVVYNHTAETDHLGPTLCFRGIDNAAYYRLRTDAPRYYENHAGCGNNLDLRHPRTLQLVMDSLRYWVQEMHVDGFRFDLATVLARGIAGFDPDAPFLAAVAQDPVLAEVKLIAEPWDVGEGGYVLGQFPAGWAEWNDKYRTFMRSFWRGDAVALGTLGCRLAGSSDLYAGSGRTPQASVNYIASHDGFTLHDLVSYGHKHNQANGDDNRDGCDATDSCNFGVEGPTEDRTILADREKMKRNFIATLAVSLGVPMITAGDEFGRTQGGNNNAFCQDSEEFWLNWRLDEAGRRFLDFARQALKTRRDHAVLRSPKFFEGRTVGEARLRDVTWLSPSGVEMTVDDWENADGRALAALIHGGSDRSCGPDGALAGETLLIAINGAPTARVFRLPSDLTGGAFHCLIDTAIGGSGEERTLTDRLELAPRSLVVLEHQGTA